MTNFVVAIELVFMCLLLALFVHLTGSAVTFCVIMYKRKFVWNKNVGGVPMDIQDALMVALAAGWLYVIDVVAYELFKLKRKITRE